MSLTTMRFTFGPSVPFNEAEETLQLARMAVESLHGRERVDMEAAFSIDPAKRQFLLDVSRQAGRTLALVFAGYARREFGPDSVRVEHLSETQLSEEGASR